MILIITVTNNYQQYEPEESMRLHIASIGLVLLLIMFSSSIRSQDKTDVSDKDKASDADEFLKNPITKEEGRKIFDSLSDEKKKEIIQRWEELKKLPEDQRKKALENFYRLLNAEFKNLKDNSKEETVKNDINKSRNIPPEIFLANILHVAYFNVNWNRSKKHMQLLHTIQRDDPYFFYNLSSLTKEEQINRLLKKRDELFEKEIEEIAKQITLDGKTIAELKKLLKKQRDEEDKVEVKFIEKQANIWDQTYSKIKDNKKLFEPLIQFFQILETMEMHSPHSMSKNRVRHGNNTRGMGIEGFKNFMKLCDIETWNSAAEKMKLSKEKTEELIIGYKAIYEKYEKYEKANEFYKHRKLYQSEINTFIEKILTKEETKQFSKYIIEELMREFKGRNRKGFRNK